MSEPKRKLIVHIENRSDGQIVSQSKQAEANTRSIDELRRLAAEQGLVLPESPLIDPDDELDADWMKAVQKIAEPLMRPDTRNETGEDAHAADISIGTRNQKRSIKIEKPGKPTVTIESQSSERGIFVSGHSRGIGDILHKMHEAGVKTCVAVTNGVVRIFGARKDRDQIESKSPDGHP